MIEKSVINKVAVAIIDQGGETIVETRSDDNSTFLYDLPSMEAKEGESAHDIACAICNKTCLYIGRDNLTLIGYVKLENEKTILNITIYATSVYYTPPVCEDFNTWFIENLHDDCYGIAPTLAIKSLISSTMLQKRRCFRAEITVTGPEEAIESMHFETFENLAPTP